MYTLYGIKVTELLNIKYFTWKRDIFSLFQWNEITGYTMVRT